MKALRIRRPNTGTWIFNTMQYSKWIVDASLFWLHGIPGCGKTIIASTILEDLFQRTGGDQEIAVVYFYFDFNDTRKKDPEQMVRSLISQLLRKSSMVPDSLVSLFKTEQETNRRPSTDELLNELWQLMQGYQRCYVILDALDECADHDTLLHIIEEIAAWALDTLHCLFTSRKEWDIDMSFESLIEKDNSVALRGYEVNRDIQAYIRHRVTVDPRLRKWQSDPQICRKIETELIRGAHEMFRWAACQLDRLGKCRNRNQLYDALGSLPRTLNDTYQEMLCDIDKNDVKMAAQILRWLAFAARPLGLEEVAEVIALDTGREPAFRQEEKLEDPREIIDIFASLITISDVQVTIVKGSKSDSKQILSHTVSLAHASVKDYLTSECIRNGRAAIYALDDTSCNSFLAQNCLLYLLRFDKPNALDISGLEENRLIRYAAAEWITHAEVTMGKDKTLNSLILRFLCTGDGAFLNWARVYDPDRPKEGPKFSKGLERIPTPLYFASYFNATDIMRELLNKVDADVNALPSGGMFGSALHLATKKGHEEIVKLLLDHGADIHESHWTRGDALYTASASGHQEIIHLLLSRGADPVSLRGLDPEIPIWVNPLM